MSSFFPYLFPRALKLCKNWCTLMHVGTSPCDFHVTSMEKRWPWNVYFIYFDIFSYSLRNFHDSKHTYSKDLCSCEARRAISDLTDTAAWNALEFEVILFIFCLTLKEKKHCFPTVWDDFNEAIQGRKIFVREDREFGALVSHPLFYISYLFLFFIHFAFGKKVDESLSKDWKPKQFPRLRT